MECCHQTANGTRGEGPWWGGGGETGDRRTSKRETEADRGGEGRQIPKRMAEGQLEEVQTDVQQTDQLGVILRRNQAVFGHMGRGWMVRRWADRGEDRPGVKRTMG